VSRAKAQKPPRYSQRLLYGTSKAITEHRDMCNPWVEEVQRLRIERTKKHPHNPVTLIQNKEALRHPSFGGLQPTILLMKLLYNGYERKLSKISRR